MRLLGFGRAPASRRRPVAGDPAVLLDGVAVAGGDRDALGRHLREVMGHLRDLRAGDHPCVVKARLAPSCGRITLCDVRPPGLRSRPVRVSLRPGTGAEIALVLHRSGAAARDLGPVAAPGPGRGESIVVEEVGARIWLAVAPNLPFTSWPALASFARALLLWSGAIGESRTLTEAEFAAVRDGFQAALADDHRNPLVHYNLGALLYTRYGEQATRQAIRHFSIAFSATFERDDAEVVLLAGQALTGLSLSYCQLLHRFGQSGGDLLVNCRVTAARAVALLRDLVERDSGRAHLAALLRARYAEAFSYHVTDEHDDVRRAIEIYEDVVRGWEDLGSVVPAVILNNLGYQYMSLEGRDEPGCDPAPYERATALFRRALDVEPDYEMAWANMGNVQRLMKRYADAEASYDAAKDAARSQGRAYPPAHIESARLHLEMGDEPRAAEEFRTSLAMAESAEARATIHGQYAEALRAVNRPDEAVRVAEAGLALRPDEPRCRAVIAARGATGSGVGSP